MKLFFKKGLYWPFSFLIIGIFYLFLAPNTVQFGDTSEFATNGYLFRVSHPPGYPLFTYLLWIMTHLIPLSTVFFRASLLQIFFSLGTLFCLQKISGKKNALVFLLLLSLASGKLYWKFSLLPDVFMLNLLLMACYSFFYFREKSEKNLFISSFFYGLALANHQTAIFIFPLFLFQWWEIKEPKVLLKSFVMISSTFIVLNLGLFFLDDSSLGSWGELRNLTDLIHHILRKDYGTLTLSNSFGNNSHLLVNVGLFLQILLTDYFVFLIIFCLALTSFILKKIRFTLKEVLYFLVTLGIFLVFFSLSNVYPKAAAGLILERFYLLPLGMFVTLAFRVLPYLNSKAVFYLLLSASIINTSSNLYRHFPENNLAKDDFLQRHYTFMLESLPKDAILMIGGDTHVFSLYYLQEILNIRRDVTILTPTLYPYSWYRKKIQSAFPQKNFSRYEIKSKLIHENIDYLIISPNIDRFPIFADAFLMDLVDLKKYHLIHRSILIEIKKGPSEPMFDCPPLIKSPHFNNLGIYQANLEIFLWYGSCDYFGGTYHLEKKNNDFSLFMLKRAMQKVPYSDLYHRAYCEALILTQAQDRDISECYQELKKKELIFPYRFNYLDE